MNIFRLDTIKRRKKQIKYLIAGGTAFLVNVMFLYLFTDIIGLYYLVSTALSFTISFVVSFSMQKFWTFRDNSLDNVRKQLASYLIVGLMNLGLNIGLMYVFVDLFGVWYVLAQVFSAGMIAVESYLIYNFIIFGQTQERGNL